LSSIFLTFFKIFFFFFSRKKYSQKETSELALFHTFVDGTSFQHFYVKRKYTVNSSAMRSFDEIFPKTKKRFDLEGLFWYNDSI